MTSHTKSRDQLRQKIHQRRIELAHMESDLAYFQARLEILGEPKTTSEIAQRKLFRILSRTIGNKIVEIRRELAQRKKAQQQQRG